MLAVVINYNKTKTVQNYGE